MKVINNVFFPFQRFSSVPKVLATVRHSVSKRPQDAMNIWIEELKEDYFRICLREVRTFDGKHQNLKVVSYASVNSSSAHVPWANPRALAFFKEKNWANFPGWGHTLCLNASGWGRKKRANAPPLGSSPSNTSAVFLINQ